MGGRVGVGVRVEARVEVGAIYKTMTMTAAPHPPVGWDCRRGRGCLEIIRIVDNNNNNKIKRETEIVVSRDNIHL